MTERLVDFKPTTNNREKEIFWSHSFDSFIYLLFIINISTSKNKNSILILYYYKITIYNS